MRTKLFYGFTVLYVLLCQLPNKNTKLGKQTCVAIKFKACFGNDQRKIEEEQSRKSPADPSQLVSINPVCCNQVI